MSTNPVQAPLKSLLPSTTAIPSHLLSAATSLLSVSRQRATNLKPDEEIARAHACAEIACKRLRAHHRLPNIKSGNGAPCRPAVYKRLMTFLEGVLADVDLLGTPSKMRRDGDARTPTTGGRSTGKKRVIQELDLEEDDTEAVETPTKKRKVVGGTSMMTPTKLSAQKMNGFLGRIQASSSKRKAKKNEAEAPEYVLPAVRMLCKAFKTPEMVPHVYTGVCIGTEVADLCPDLDAQKTQEGGLLDEEALDIFKIHVLCITIASFILTLTKMREGDMTQEIFDIVSEYGLTIMNLSDGKGSLRFEIEEWVNKLTAWAIENEPVINWINSIPVNTLPAFKLSQVNLSNSKVGNVGSRSTGIDEVSGGRTPGSRRHKDDRISRREEIKKELEKEDPDDVLLPGLGTMVHDAIDYFSAERVAEYAEWKAGILRRIEVIETGAGGRRGKAAAVVG